MHVYTLPIGDWGRDGHGRSDDFQVATNKSKKEIIDAYISTSRVLDMAFDEINPFHPTTTPNVRYLVRNDGDCTLSEEVLAIFKAHDVDLSVFSTYNDYVDDGETGVMVLEEPDDGVELFMSFCKIACPSLTWEIIRPERDYLFGYGEDLNISVGYGLYTD